MELLKYLQEIRNPVLDMVNILFTNLGQETVLVVIMCLMYWCMNKKYAYKMGFAYFTSGIIIQTLKIICTVPRPWLLDSSLKPVEQAVDGATGYSFPSGHTQAATSLYGTIAWNTKRKSLKVIMFILILLVAFSRMYLGVHSPLDVTAAMFVTIITVFIVNYLIDSEFVYQLRRDTVAAIMLVIPLVVIAFGTMRVLSGDVDVDNSKDLFKTAGSMIGFVFGWYLEGNVLNFDETYGTNKQKAVRLIVGLVTLIVLKFGLKAIFGTDLVQCVCVYGFIMLWAVFLYPWIFTKMQKAK